MTHPFLAWMALTVLLAPARRAYDVVIYGGTSSGIAAAVQVARMGKSVVVLEPGRHLGGLTSGGLGATDIGNKAAIGGIAREFYRRIRAHYTDDEHWIWQKRTEFRGRGHEPGEDAAWTFEPHVAEGVFRDMVREAKVEVCFGERLDLARGVCMKEGRIVSITMESGRTLEGGVFIDASYEGDLLAKAGVSYRVGREANAEFGETLNGVQTRRATHHQFLRKVDPWRVPGDRESGLLPGIAAGGPGEDGSGDRRVQAYCFRICATDVPENRRPWPKPADYDPNRYELLLRNFEAGDDRKPWHPVRMPNRKTDSNNNCAFSTDWIGGNHAYPDADHAARQRIVQQHASYQKGLLWTLANHPRVPEEVRAYFTRWGLAKDEFEDNDNWPRRLYVREARRMVSSYVMTEHDCRGTRQAADSVGLGAYGMDSHHVQRYVDADGWVRNEGDIQVHGSKPYPIAFRSIVPRAGQCRNLLVPVCVSATHIAFGSIRMEPVFMVLGQSAATAACLAIDADVPVQSVDYAELRQRLLADGQVLEWVVAEKR